MFRLPPGKEVSKQLKAWLEVGFVVVVLLQSHCTAEHSASGWWGSIGELCASQSSSPSQSPTCLSFHEEKHPFIVFWAGWNAQHTFPGSPLVCLLWLHSFSFVSYTDSSNPLLYMQVSFVSSLWTSPCFFFQHQMTKSKHSIPSKGKPLIYMDYYNPTSRKQNQKIVWLPNDSEMQKCCQQF